MKNTKGLVVSRSRTVSASAVCWIAFYRECLLIAGRRETLECFPGESRSNGVSREQLMQRGEWCKHVAAIHSSMGDESELRLCTSSATPSWILHYSGLLHFVRWENFLGGKFVIKTHRV